MNNPVITLSDILTRGFDRRAFDDAIRSNDVTAISENHPHNFMSEDEINSFEGIRIVEAVHTLGTFHDVDIDICNETWAEHYNEAIFAGHMTNPCECRGCRGWRNYSGANSTIDYIENLRRRYVRANTPVVDDGMPF